MLKIFQLVAIRHRILIAFTLIFILLSYIFFDISVATFFHFDNPYRKIIFTISEIGNSTGYIIIGLTGWLFFHFVKKNLLWKNRFSFFFLSIVVSGLVGNIIKFILGRARPPQLFEHNYFGFYGLGTSSAFQSFPSGHSITAAALATVLVVFFPRLKYLGISIALCVGLTRVILNNHYPSDVALGLLIGFFVTLSLREVYKEQGRVL